MDMQTQKFRKRIKTLSGYQLTDGTMEPCVACASGKAKQKNVPKVSESVKATLPNERVFQDLAKIMGKKWKESPLSSMALDG